MIRVCHKHFEQYRSRRGPEWEAVDRETETCPDCVLASQAEVDRRQREDTIDPTQPIGQHIGLRCGKCGARYHTKNLGHIGARSIFVVDRDCEHGLGDLEVER